MKDFEGFSFRATVLQTIPYASPPSTQGNPDDTE